MRTINEIIVHCTATPDGKDYTEVFEEHQVAHHTSVELVKEIDKKKARAAERKARSSQDASGDQPSDN